MAIAYFQPVTRGELGRIFARKPRSDGDLRAGCSRPARAAPSRGRPIPMSRRIASCRVGYDNLRDLPDFEKLEDAGLLSKESLLREPEVLEGYGEFQAHRPESSLLASHVTSSASAMPWPPPMHRVTTPRFNPSRFMEWRSRIVGRAGCANRVTVGDRAALDNKMRVFQEEIFGPVVSVTTFKDDAEALEIANDTLYGLGAGVWTRDGSRAYRMGRAIQAGRVWTNCYHAYPAHAAFGGYKQSGIGRENHKMMLDHYQQTKNLLVSYSPKKLASSNPYHGAGPPAVTLARAKRNQSAPRIFAMNQ